jgi:formate-dependent nitrite reductase membrane component NrfD
MDLNTALVELSSNRHNPGIDPELDAWGWEIPVYLFLGGLVAGLLILGGYHILRGRNEPAKEAYPLAPMLGVVLLSVGMGALFLDLSHKAYVWRLYLTFQPTSPMSWGAWILLLVYPALLAAALLNPPERVPFGDAILARVKVYARWLRMRPRLVQGIGAANLLGGVALGLYTGILLGSLGARPLWNSAILGPLFLFSGLSTAAALMHLLSMASQGSQQESFGDAMLAGFFKLINPKLGGEVMLRADTSFVTIEMAILALWLIGMLTATSVHKEAAALVLTGAYAPAFWSLVILSGLVGPLFIQVAELSGKIRHTAAPAVLVLIGGFALRWILVAAGQTSHW